jgi:hypothetical protein
MYTARLSLADSSRMRTLSSILKPECLHDGRFGAKSSLGSSRSTKKLDHSTAQYLDHRLEPGERDVEEGTLSVKPASSTMACKCGFHRSMSAKVWCGMTMSVRSGLAVASA